MDHLTFLEKPRLTGTVSLLGIPVDIGKDGSGTSEIPDYLRQFGLRAILESLGLAVKDLGNVPCPSNGAAILGDPRIKYLSSIVQVAEQTARLVSGEIQQGNKVIALGGDHSMSVGTISGAAAACTGDAGVIWIDSHGDINTHETTISGNIHGMSAAALMGFGHPDLVNVYQPGIKIKKENMLHIGLKDLDQGEIDLIRREGLNVITILDLMRHGFGWVASKIDELTSRVQHVWVSLDIDAIDKEYAPATLMASAGGLDYREITNLARYIGATCPVIGFDIAELVTQRDIGEKTTQLVIELIANFLGSEFNWYTEYMKHEEAKQKKRSRPGIHILT